MTACNLNLVTLHPYYFFDVRVTLVTSKIDYINTKTIAFDNFSTKISQTSFKGKQSG
jgi:hypothetical protein